jgi:hypothetical protein
MCKSFVIQQWRLPNTDFHLIGLIRVYILLLKIKKCDTLILNGLIW